MAFVRNNIRYRAAASKALEGYFNSKAFILSELLKASNGFSDTAKEILLLLFNEHAHWLWDVERLLLDKDTITAEETVVMCHKLVELDKRVTTIFQEHPEVFSPGIVKHWQVIHRQPTLTLHDAIRSIEGSSQILAFPMATEYLMDYLSATLFEMYEIDALLGSDLVRQQESTNRSQPDTIIMFLDDVTLAYRKITGKPPEYDRLAYYKEHLLMSDREFLVEVRDYSAYADRESRESAYSDFVVIEDQDYVKEVRVIRRTQRSHCEH